jgi:fyn-related kinase
VLVGDWNVVKIADFGLAKMLNSDKKIEIEKSELTKFPIKWTAPEMFQFDIRLREYTIKSDVWSFGILMYELITLGGEPYRGIKSSEVVRAFKDRWYRIPIPPGLCTSEFYAVMLKCWKHDPSERPTFHYLFDYFDCFDINNQSFLRYEGN